MTSDMHRSSNMSTTRDISVSFGESLRVIWEHRHKLMPKLSNFRLADLVTIMNGVCGAFSVFSSARYLITNDEAFLYAALSYPVAGLMFDFMDGKVARWRKETSMLGQELDSLADLVSSCHIFYDNKHAELKFLRCALGVVRSSARFISIRCWPPDIPRHRSANSIHLLWPRSAGSLQRNSGIRTEGCYRKIEILRRITHPLLLRSCRPPFVLDMDRPDRREIWYSWRYCYALGR